MLLRTAHHANSPLRVFFRNARERKKMRDSYERGGKRMHGETQDVVPLHGNQHNICYVFDPREGRCLEPISIDGAMMECKRSMATKVREGKSWTIPLPYPVCRMASAASGVR